MSEDAGQHGEQHHSLRVSVPLAVTVIGVSAAILEVVSVLGGFIAAVFTGKLLESNYAPIVLVGSVATGLWAGLIVTFWAVSVNTKTRKHMLLALRAHEAQFFEIIERDVDKLLGSEYQHE